MPSRRELLVALASGAAGCSGRTRSADDTGTLTPAPVPTETPVASDVESSRFDVETPVPANARLFHLLEADESPDAFAVPSRERFSPETTAGMLSVRNRGPTELFVSIDWRLLKHTGHRWVEIPSPLADRSGIVPVDPEESWTREHRIDHVFGLDRLGPGLYARLETARFEDAAARASPFGALFEVRKTDFELTPTQPATIDGDVARVEFGGAPSELVLERAVGAESADTTALVPEAVGAHPVFPNSVPHLDAAAEVRVRTAAASVAIEDLDSLAVCETDIGPGDPISVAGRTFTVRAEES